MGWYVTCQICGTTEKYGLGCDCYHKEMMYLFKKRKGCIIEDMFILDDFETLLYEQLLPVNGTVNDRFYLVTCIKDAGSDEYTCWRRMQELSAEEFHQAKSRVKDDQDKEEKQEQEQEKEDKEEQEKWEDEPSAEVCIASINRLLKECESDPHPNKDFIDQINQVIKKLKTEDPQRKSEEEDDDNRALETYDIGV